MGLFYLKEQKDIISQKVIPLLAELIQNRCVNDGSPSSGQEIRSALTLKRFFASYGLEAEILESAPGRANLILRLKGENSSLPTLTFLNHLDVVPVTEDNWTVDPFSGEVRAGYVWGRGAVDMLNITATQAVAFAEYFQTKAKLPGDLLFIATADEEASGRLGSRWLVENHWDKIKSDYVVTELGGFFFKRDDGNPGLTITVGEKGVVWVKLKFKGKASHGSLPYATDNAAFKAALFLQKLKQYQAKISFTKEYWEMVENSFQSKSLKKMLRQNKKIDQALKKLNQIDEGVAKFFHAATRLTLSPNILKAGNKINIIPDQATIELDVRILPGQTVEYVISELQKILGLKFGSQQSEVSVEISDYYPATISAKQTPLYEATKEIIASVYPLAKPVPYFIGAVTDGRFFRSKGAVVYGFSLFNDDFTLAEYVRMLHGNDERISIKSLEFSYNFFYQLPDLFYKKLRLED